MSGTRRTGLVAGGVAVLVLLVVGVWVAVLVRVLDSDEPDPDGPDPAGAGDDAYVVVDRLCESVDTGSVFAVLPASGDGLQENVLEVDGGTLRNCIQGLGEGASVGSLWIRVSVYDDPELASRTHDSNVRSGTMTENADTIEDVDGPWQEGALGLGAGIGGFTAGAEVCVRDGNLTACVAMRLTAAPDLADAPTDDDVAAAVRPVAEDILARSRP